MNYAHTVTVQTPFDETVQMVRDALTTQGFGILTEIDVRATFAAKLSPEKADAVGDYLILGACNPPLAHRAHHHGPRYRSPAALQRRRTPQPRSRRNRRPGHRPRHHGPAQ